MNIKEISAKLLDIGAALTDLKTIDLDSVSASINELNEIILGETEEALALKEKITSLESTIESYAPILQNLKDNIKGKCELLYAKDAAYKTDIITKLDAETTTLPQLIELGNEIEKTFREKWSENSANELKTELNINPKNYKSGGC